MSKSELVVKSIVKVAKHKSDDASVAELTAFVENADSTSYIFENTNWEKYVLVRKADSFVLDFPERDYSGDPAVAYITNKYLAAIAVAV